MTDSRLDWLPGAQAVLDTLADGLVRADLDVLLASEGRLSDVAALLARESRPGLPLTPARRHQLETLWITLARCRRLGASLTDVVRLSRAARSTQGEGDVYGPQGAPRPAASTAGFEAQG